jgi:flagellar secretion chaperone FliS
MWRDAYIESRVTSADPIELVQMLYDHALLRIRDARNHLAAGDIVGRSKAISTTIAILSELESSLDHNAGGSISGNLAALYQYMRTRLTTANLKQEQEPLLEVENLLSTLSEAWGAVRTRTRSDAGFDPAPSAAKPSGDVFAVEPDHSHAAHAWSA